MSFRGWGQIIKPWLLRSLTRYAVQPLFVRFSWKHWNVLTLPSCGKQNRNFVYIRETHTQTHRREGTRDKVLRGRIDPSHTDTHISPLQPFDLVVGWLFQFHMPFVSICDQYDKYRFLLFCGLEPETKISLFLIILFVLSDRLLRDGTNTIGHLVVRPFLYISLSIIRNKKKNRARRRSTDRSGQNVLPVAKQLERLRYGCYLIRSLYLFLSMFYRPLKFLFTKNIQIAFIFIFFVSLFLSLSLLLLGDNIVCSGRRRLCILLIIFFVSLSFSVFFFKFCRRIFFFFWLFHFSLCTVCFPSLLITEIVDIRFLKIHISFHWFFFLLFWNIFPYFKRGNKRSSNLLSSYWRRSALVIMKPTRKSFIT